MATILDLLNGNSGQQQDPNTAQQILSARFQPNMDNTAQSIFQNATGFQANPNYQAISPEMIGMQQAMQQQDLQQKLLQNQIAGQTGMQNAQSEIALKNAQAGYYGDALQRDLAEKAFQYANDPQMAQAKMMAAYMQSLSGQPNAQQQMMPGQGQAIPMPPSPQQLNGMIPPSGDPLTQYRLQNGLQTPPIDAQRTSMGLPIGTSTVAPQINASALQPSSGPTLVNAPAVAIGGGGGFNPMGAMLAKSLGLTDMQIGPNGQPMPIPGSMKIENGSVITFDQNGIPHTQVPQNPQARVSIENTVNFLSNKLDELDKAGAAVSEKQPWLKNQTNALLSSPLAQQFQAGTKAQTIRQEMANYVMAALPDYMQAKGITPGMERSLGGQELILKAIGIDPGASIQANKSILGNISRVSGTGGFASQLGRINVTGPNGESGTIDPAELKDAMANGWKQVQ